MAVELILEQAAREKSKRERVNLRQQ